ncbi:methyltransferase domain-containing protein [Mesobacillus harenae]|uniref:methyltransferase domain-containing protein n=1 Tax=Mesobacillus harenae TaxID=2213203 RepID=UPI0015803AC9
MGKSFAKWYDRFMNPLERGRFKSIRKQLIEKAEGNVLELGSGTGVNFPLYRHVTVKAIEPSPYMIEGSLPKREQAKVPIEIFEAGAEALPFADDAFDTVVGTLVYCTIPDVSSAFQEMKRVCKPGGKILLFEHVKMKQPLLAKLQDRLTPYWSRICDGCCLDRETVRLVQESGFLLAEKREYFNGLFVTMVLINEKGPLVK